MIRVDRLELLEAQAQQTPIISVLVGDAAMPRRNQFPEQLSVIANVNAAKLRGDPDFKIDVERIIDRVTELRPTVVGRDSSGPHDVTNTISVGDKPRPPAFAGDSVWFPIQARRMFHESMSRPAKCSTRSRSVTGPRRRW